MPNALKYMHDLIGSFQSPFLDGCEAPSLSNFFQATSPLYYYIHLLTFVYPRVLLGIHILISVEEKGGCYQGPSLK